MIVTYVRWGSKPPFTIKRYEFQTLSEHEAFVTGVDEACGWMDYAFIEPGECVRCGASRGAHRSAAADAANGAERGCTRFETYDSYEAGDSGR